MEIVVPFRRKRGGPPRPVRRFPARVARQVALAHSLRWRLEAGEFKDYASMSRALGFTRARITQIMDLLLLAPDIQEEILFLEAQRGTQPIGEKELRRALMRSVLWDEQRAIWERIKEGIGARAALRAATSPSRRARGAPIGTSARELPVVDRVTVEGELVLGRQLPEPL